MTLRRDLPSPPELPTVPTLWDSLEPPQVVPVPTTDPKPGSIQEAFEQFHRLNPWVYEALRRLAVDLVERGRTRIGIGMLFEVLRWYHQRDTSDEASPFKLNNNYRSRYARLLAEQEPALAGAFEVRELKAA